MEEEIQLIKRMKENNKAIRKDFEHIRELYADQYIAVDEGKILGHAANLELVNYPGLKPEAS